MAVTVRQTPQWSYLSMFAGVVNEHYQQCYKYLRTGIPPDFSIVTTVLNLQPPSLSNNPFAITTYIQSFHAAVLQLYANAGVLMTENLGPSYNNSITIVTNAFASYPISPTGRVPSLLAYKVRGVLSMKGEFPFTIIPTQARTRGNFEFSDITNDGDTTQFGLLSGDGAPHPFRFWTANGAVNYGAAQAVVMGAKYNDEYVYAANELRISWTPGFDDQFYLPNWCMPYTSLTSQLFRNGTRVNTSGCLSQGFVMPNALDMTTSIFFLYNDIYAPMVKGVEDWIKRIDSAIIGI